MNKDFNGSNESKTFMQLNIFQICVICDYTDKQPALGTGFCFLKTNWIVTAKHVVMQDGLVRKNLTAVFIGENKKNVSLKLKIKAIHKESDICILQIIDKNNPCTNPLYPGYEDLNSSKGIMFCGYDSESLALSIEHVLDFNMSSRFRENEEFILEFNSKFVRGGFSGGPIFGNGGVLLGVIINLINSADNPEKKIARGISIKTLMNAIDISIKDEFMEIKK